MANVPEIIHTSTVYTGGADKSHDHLKARYQCGTCEHEYTHEELLKVVKEAKDGDYKECKHKKCGTGEWLVMTMKDCYKVRKYA